MLTLLSSAVLTLLLAPATSVDSRPTRSGQEPAPRILLDQSPRAVEYQINRLTNDELVRVERKADDVQYRPIYYALLTRPGMPKPVREEALAALAALDKASPAQILLDAMAKVPADTPDPGDRLLAMLLGQPVATLRSQRAAFEKAAAEATAPLVLGGTYGAMMIADDDPGPAWQTAAQQGQTVALLRAVPHLPDAPVLRSRLAKPVLTFLDQTREPAARAAAVTALAAIRPDTPTFDRLAQEVLAPAGPDSASRDAAIAALMRIPETAWPRARLEPLARAIVTMVKEAAPASRTTPALIDAMQLGDKLAALLPEETRRSVRRDLRALGVQVVPIAAVPEQMLFDVKWFTVQMAKPVQIVLTNPDAMPHNLVVGAPGSVQEIGTAAAAMPPPSNLRGRAYVPNSPLVLHATRLLSAGETERLNFTAPAKPGEYVFVCTFPGHWIRMYGVMLVVPDMEAWEANPTVPTDPITGKPFPSQR